MTDPTGDVERRRGTLVSFDLRQVGCPMNHDTTISVVGAFPDCQTLVRKCHPEAQVVHTPSGLTVYSNVSDFAYLWLGNGATEDEAWADAARNLGQTVLGAAWSTSEEGREKIRESTLCADLLEWARHVDPIALEQCGDCYCFFCGGEGARSDSVWHTPECLWKRALKDG